MGSERLSALRPGPPLWAGYTAWGVHPDRKSFNRLCVQQTKSHSARTLATPRNEKRRKAWPSLI